MPREPAEQAGLRIGLRGVVQGVGMRPFVHRVARECAVTGHARNSGEGVAIDAFGDAGALGEFVSRLRATPPPSAVIEQLLCEPVVGVPPEDFEIIESRRDDEGWIGLAPDLATCDRCLEEIADPLDRRYRHPFASCTACGPRFSITRALPYDRINTHMDAFVQCKDCQQEYEDPESRRHHAETNACPRCGPTLWLEASGTDTRTEGEAGLQAAARLLQQGAIVAIRGVGGYHLACDATNGSTLRRLRKRKHRPRKPFAVMLPNLAAVRAAAFCDSEDEALLRSAEAPIVLLRRRDLGPIADEVAPGLPWLGVLLPYTPMHHLLLAAVARPLVMTSGNLSGAPIVTSVSGARRDLAPLADAFLHHDREIETACDDSVARRIAGRSAWLRRSRGVAPRPLRLARSMRHTVLAFGAQHQNTLCLAHGTRAWMSPHLGDLESPEALAGAERGAERLEAWLGVRAEVIAHDLNAAYESTRLALRRECALRVPVQHHHAHAVSAMAEHGLAGPALAVTFDGTGLGSDGSAWGGELLLARADGFERLATLRPIALAGGEAAIREVWRLALAALEDAFDGAPPLESLALFRALEPERIDAVRGLIRRGVRCVPAHGAGRWFDVFGALGLDLASSAHSGDVATAWNGVADPREERAYAFALHSTPHADSPALLEIDLRPTLRAAVRDRIAGRPAAEISGRFHATLAGSVAATLTALGGEVAGLPVVLSGGCFQNALLSEQVAAAVGRRFEVFQHERVPAGDGGIALGQAIVADAVARRGAASVDV